MHVRVFMHAYSCMYVYIPMSLSVYIKIYEHGFAFACLLFLSLSRSLSDHARPICLVKESRGNYIYIDRVYIHLEMLSFSIWRG